MGSLLNRAKPVLEKLLLSGYQAYIVGGAVRDTLLGLEVHDVDIATSALPEAVMALFAETVPLGLQHGTVLVVEGGEAFEVTTFRSEKGYSDHRHPDSVVFEADVEKDLARRDFTFNAMALDYEGRLIDPFQGQRDLDDRRLVTVGKATERFQEDPLRMLRAARFASQLQAEPSEEVVSAIKASKNNLQYIASERIRDELTKCLNGLDPYRGLRLLKETELCQSIEGLQELPQNLSCFRDVRFQKLEEEVERWSLLFYVGGAKVDVHFLRAFRFSKKRSESIQSLLKFYSSLKSDTILTPILLYTFGEEVVTSAARLNEAMNRPSWLSQIQEMKKTLPIQSRSDLQVNGRDLMNWKQMNGGPWVEELLKTIEEKVLLGELENTKETIRKWVKKNGR